MADGEDVPGSPPLPKKGAYNIDFDALDASVNPFESKVKLGSSPPIQSSSSYNFDADALDNIDPFKPKTAIPNSPVGSPNLNNNGQLTLPHDETLKSSDNLPGPDEGVKAAGAEPDIKASPKKKKVLKKGKAQSKIKAMRNVKAPEATSDDIQIFMPGEKSKVSDADGNLPLSQPPREKLLPADSEEERLPPPPDSTVELVERKARPSSLEEDVPCDPAPEAMVSSSEMDSQFVNTEDLDDLAHTVASEAFSKSSEINDLQKNIKNNMKKTSAESASPSLEENCDPSVTFLEKGSKPSVPQQVAPGQHPSDDGSPAVKKSPRRQASEEGGKEKHPAARVLEANQSLDAAHLKPADIKKSSSPAMADDGGAAGKGTMVQLVQVLRYSQSDWNKLKQELELGFQATLLSKEREWSALLGERDKKLENLQESNRRLKQTNEDMRAVVAEFEKTISQLQAEKEKHKADLSKTTTDLEHDRDQAIEDLQSVESAFSDLHRRYEKSKGIIEGFKKNEEQLKQHVEDLQAKLKKSETKLLSLRSQAEEKLDRANEDIEQIKRSTKSDVARLEAALKKSEIRICTLEESLQRKEKEAQELTSICDELIAKVG